mgnify:CR=1 FL=1
MSQTYILCVILIMALTGFLPRVIPMAIIRKHPIPHWFKVWLTFVPRPFSEPWCSRIFS